MSYASVIEPLRAANLLSGATVFEVMNFAAAGNMAASSTGVSVRSDGDILDSGDFAMVLVVAGGRSSTILGAPVSPVLRALDRRGVMLGGVSGGPLLLAHAGLMEGRRMTVHWEHAPTLAEISPSLMIERSLYVIDRDRVTCAGGIAPVDMMYALISGLYGNEFARKVSDWFLHTEIRPSQGSQRSSLAQRYGTTCRIVLDSIELMRGHIADPVSLCDLADFAGVSPRHLIRMFRKELDQTTMAFYLDLRLRYACGLLSNSSLTITEIALATGFGGSPHFATAFRRRYGCSPSDWNGAAK